MKAALVLVDQLLEHADLCLSRARSAASPGPRAWLRASALLQRQTLELLLETIFLQRMPGVELSSFRAQLLVLPQVLHSENALPVRVRSSWGILSAVCHRGGAVERMEPERLEEVLAVLREWRGHGVWGR